MMTNEASKVILLVEDNPSDEKLALRALSTSPLAPAVVVARDGVEALDYLFGTEAGEDPGVLPLVMLLDLKLPRIDGLEVLRRVRADQRTCFLPVVVLTSSDEQKDIVESYQLGTNSYVRKPVDYVSFAATLQTLAVYWLMLNIVPPPYVPAP